MDERIKIFTDELLKQLAGLPEDEINEAVGFYEEYLTEAIDAGKDIDSVIRDMGAPERIAATIKAETSIAKARTNPGIRNFNSSFTSAFKLVTTPLSVFWLSITAFVSYSTVAVFFGGAFVTALAAVIIFFGMMYEAFRIPLKFFPSVIGTAGAGIFSAGICLIAALYLFRVGKLFIKFSANLIRLMLRLSGKDVTAASNKAQIRNSKVRTVPVILAAIAVGFVLLAVSGLPQTYFTIFNSMRAADEKSVSYEYDPGDIDRIIINTANSQIRVEKNQGDKIAISYNQPPWMDHDIESKAGMLEFKEKSSGMLPLFQLAVMHEGMSGITLLLPEGYSPESLGLESTGGHITVNGFFGETNVKTLNGNITCNTSGVYETLKINAGSLNGILQVGDKKIGAESGKGPAYTQNNSSGKWLTILSRNGNITIK